MSTVVSAALMELGGAAFVEREIARCFRAARVDAQFVREQLGWAVLDDLVCSSTFEPNMFRLVGRNGRVDPDLYLESSMTAGMVCRRLRLGVLHHELGRGGTLTVNGADRMSGAVRANRESVEYIASELAWCNGFLSDTAESSFGRHFDNHDTLVVQAEGTKHWSVLAPSTGALVVDGELSPGDVLHVPRGWEHQVTGTGVPSLHWTFGFVWPSAGALASAELEPVLRGSNDPCADLDAFLAGDRMDRPGLVTRKRATSLLRRSGTSLPWSLGVPIPDLDRVRVRWAARLPPVVETGEDGIVVSTLGKRARVDPRLHPAMERMDSGCAVLCRDLVDGECTERHVRAFLSWALEQGLVILEGASP